MKEVTYIGYKAMDMGFDAHLTLLYTGKMTQAEEFEARLILDELPRNMVSAVTRDTIECFGPNKDIAVLRVTPMHNDLVNLRNRFIEAGIPNPSEYEWNPHITLNLAHTHTLHIPAFIRLTDLNLY